MLWFGLVLVILGVFLIEELGSIPYHLTDH